MSRAIRFPRLHIAESVVNRIMNAHDELERPKPKAKGSGRAVELAAAALDFDDPAPDPTLEGGALDLALSAPIPPVAPDPAVIQGAASGEASPLEALLQPKGVAR